MMCAGHLRVVKPAFTTPAQLSVDPLPPRAGLAWWGTCGSGEAFRWQTLSSAFGGRYMSNGRAHDW